jgi:hypothetical protein
LPVGKNVGKYLRARVKNLRGENHCLKAYLLLDFKERINITLEEPVFVLWKVPYFLDMKELITLLEGLFQLQTHPITM